MCRERSVRCTDPPTWPLAFGCLQEIYLLTQPPTTAWQCDPRNHNSVNCLHIILFLFYQGKIIAGRLAQTIVYGHLFCGRQVVNKEVDLVLLLSLSSTLRGERKSLIPWKTAAVSYKGSLFTGMRGATGQGRQPALGVPKFFTLCGAAVSCMNPQLWPSAPTPEKSLHWHRAG